VIFKASLQEKWPLIVVDFIPVLSLTNHLMVLKELTSLSNNKTPTSAPTSILFQSKKHKKGVHSATINYFFTPSVAGSGAYTPSSQTEK